MRSIVLFLCVALTSSLYAQSSEAIRYSLPQLRQMNTSTCWLNCAALSFDLAGSEIAGRSVEFSRDFFVLQELRSRAVVKYLGYATPWDPGAGLTRAFALALEHGLVPASQWQSRRPLLEYHSSILKDLQRLIEVFTVLHGQKIEFLPEFIGRMDEVLLRYIGTAPPAQVEWQGERISPVELASRVLGNAAHSLAYEFRPIPYNGMVAGMAGQMAWTHILSSRGDLVPMLSVMPKTKTVLANAEAAIAKAEELFAQHRPVLMTFVTDDRRGDVTYSTSYGQKREYRAEMPAVDEYSGSHVVLLTEILHGPQGQVIGFWVQDSIADEPLDNGRRYMSREFFLIHGKTLHTFGQDCETVLVAK